MFMVQKSTTNANLNESVPRVHLPDKQCRDSSDEKCFFHRFFKIHFNDEVIRATLMSIQFENEPQEHFHLNETGDQSGNTMTKARW